VAALTVLISVILLNCGTAWAADLTDIGGHWAAAEIESAISSGYVQGYPDGTFRPDTGVTRAEFVAMLDDAFQVPAGNYDTPGDVSDQDWFAQDVKSALAAGFASGYPDGTFRPQDGVSRQEGACMLANLLKLDGAATSDFSDSGDIDSWAKPSVSGLVAAGIMTGYPDGSFRPQEAITRAEAVVMINGALASRSTTPATDQLQVTGDAVNVRSGPNTNAQIIGQAYSGDTLQAKAKNGDDWYQIDYQGASGWVDGSYVQVCQPSPAADSTADSAQANLAPAANSTVSDSTPGNTPAEPDGTDLASLDVQVGQSDAGSAAVVQATQAGAQNPGETAQQTPGDQDAANPSPKISPSDGSSAPGNGASFYGMDLAAYPGDDVMQTWWNDSPFCYTGFYLGPAPYHPDASFMDKRQVLVDQGWGLLPIYVGRQADSWNLDQGVADGDDAVNLATSAGFPHNTVIYLDIETWLPLTDSFLSYVTDWASEVESQGYVAGVYCYLDNADQLRDALPANVQFWVAQYTGSSLPSSIPSPADSGISFASAWQFVGDTSLAYGGSTLDIDFNTSTYTDPSTESVTVKK
jgi:hypothetical protein